MTRRSEFVEHLNLSQDCLESNFSQFAFKKNEDLFFPRKSQFGKLRFCKSFSSYFSTLMEIPVSWYPAAYGYKLDLFVHLNPRIKDIISCQCY